MPVPRGARIEDHFKIGDSVSVKIIKIEFDRGKQLIDFGIAPPKQ
jgi:predicted RNA-binding protein with RPS1 domain